MDGQVRGREHRPRENEDGDAWQRWAGCPGAAEVWCVARGWTRVKLLEIRRGDMDPWAEGVGAANLQGGRRRVGEAGRGTEESGALYECRGIGGCPVWCAGGGDAIRAGRVRGGGRA